LPGVEIQCYYDREDLVDRTTHTVRTNLFMGIGLVVIILMMFISNVRTALIVAINMPLALLFSFSVLYFRGKSANLLSIGAVDFGIICDSTVIIVENIYRNLATGQHADKPIKERILLAVREVDNALFFSTLIMVVAFMPLFTMQGAEGELFGPMAQTYAFALGGALFFAMTLTPVLCMYLFKNMKPTEENFFVKFLKGRYLWQLRLCLRYRWTTIIVMVALMIVTAAWPLQMIGREFMPELEEGNLWIRGVFPINENLDAVKDGVNRFREVVMHTDFTINDNTLKDLPNARWVDDNKKEQHGVPEKVVAKLAAMKVGLDKVKNEREDKLRQEHADELRKMGEEKRKDKKEAYVYVPHFDNRNAFLAALKKQLDADEFARFQEPILKHTARRAYPEVEAILVQMGRPDDGTDPSLFNNVEIYVPFRKHSEWPEVTRPNGITEVRVRRDITADLTEELARKSPGVEWAFSQYIRDNVMEGMTGVKGDNCVKIIGPDLRALEEIASKVKDKLLGIRGVEDVGIYRVMGQSNLEFAVDKKKCERFGLQVQDVAAVVASLVHGYPATQMVEGEKTFDTTIRLPFARRRDEAAILEARVDVWNRMLMPNSIPGTTPTYLTGNAIGSASATGTANQPPVGVPGMYLGLLNAFPAGLRVKDVVSPVDDFGRVKDPVESVICLDGTVKLWNVATDQEKATGKKIVDYGEFTRPGGSIISREQGKRFIAVKFAVRDRDLAGAVADVERKTMEILDTKPGYRALFGGEFEQMQDAEARLMVIIPASLGLICIFLYVAFRSFIDVLVILSNVLDVAVGGIWALYLTGTHFNVSSAVGFVSLFGVAIMEGLLLIGYFNDLRHKGLPVYESITEGATKRVRPVMITALTAIFGLLPDALSSAMGNQSAKPLAIVVVGGMAMTLFLDRYLMPVLYSFYGHREPPKDAASLSH
jgi:Cu/Ag efflux pump CusA